MTNKKTLFPTSLKGRVNERIDELAEITTRKWGSAAVPEVTVTYNLKGHVGGRANYLREEIMINKHLLEKYEDHYIEQTIGHEYAHLVAWKYFGRAVIGKPHGRHWKAIMRSFGLKPNRCHTYETKPARVSRKFLYNCPDCGENITISTVMHNRIRKGRSYIHGKKGCRMPIKFKKELQVSRQTGRVITPLG
tara:strand:- start:1505 stop:2080 length:576 start_codon:yes stop_codon:yes gene_type:complete